MLDWFGYIASLIILISLVMSSIIKLRWINLAGSVLFAIYGFLIGSIPTAVMNLGIVCINIYYLAKIYSSKEYFEMLELEPHSNFFQRFMDFYKDDIKSFGNTVEFDFNDQLIGFYILRNMITANIFVAKEINETTLEILLDFATPQYRDFKIGEYIYNKKKDFFTSKGYTTLQTTSTSQAHINYLKKMGFKNVSKNIYQLVL